MTMSTTMTTASSIASTSPTLPRSRGGEFQSHSRAPSPTSLGYYRVGTSTSKEVSRRASPKMVVSTLSSNAVERRPQADLDLQMYADRFLAIKNRPFAVSGTMPITEPLNLFFQSGLGISQVVSFPVDTAGPTLPSFDAFVAAFQPAIPPVGKGSIYDLPSRHSLIFPSSLPYSLSLDLASHPILDTIRTILFPDIQAGQYLIVQRDRLELYAPGNYAKNERDLHPRSDGLVATIVVTLPVRFLGGALAVRQDMIQEKFTGRGTKSGELEWTAFHYGCETEIQRVEQGYKFTLSYNVFVRSFGPSGLSPNPLICPNDGLLDALVGLLNRARGLRIGFYLTQDYGISPAEVLAESVVPSLKGNDAVLYHAMKLYKLEPEVRYTAGGYIWPASRTAEVSSSPGFIPAARRIGGIPTSGDEETLAVQVEDGGAVPIGREEIMILSGPEDLKVSKEKVPFLPAQDTVIDFLHVNLMLVVFVR